MDCSLSTCIKLAIILILCFWSFYTTLQTFKDFISGKTTMSIEVESHTQFPFPAITICNQTAFKNSQKNLDIHAYLESTLDESDFLQGVTTHTEIADPWSAAAGHIVTVSFHIPTDLVIAYSRYLYHFHIKKILNQSNHWPIVLISWSN